MARDEIDMVIDRHAFIAGDHAKVFDEIVGREKCLRACPFESDSRNRRVGDLDNVRVASPYRHGSRRRLHQTSTGKVQPAATMPVTLVMLEAIRDYFFETGIRIGMNPPVAFARPNRRWHIW